MRVYQVPRHAFLWLVLGAMLAVAPHLLSGPAWLAPLVAILAGWRLLVHRGRLRMPGRIVRTVILLGAVGATLFTFGTVMGPEAGVALLICAFMLKLLEMYRLRDAYVAIVLTYFVLATSLLLHQNFAMGLYVVVALGVVTAALVGVNQPEAGIHARQPLAYAGVIAAQAVPLMVVLFVLVPRVPPLWDLPLHKPQARTGMSDSMSPGDVSNLSLSKELAFRVEFEGAVPPPARRYWRGLTYSWFDGRSWSQATPQGIAESELVWFGRGGVPAWVSRLQDNRSGPRYSYRVIQEPTGRPWLFNMAVPFVRGGEAGLVRDYRLLSPEELRSARAWQVDAWPEMPRGLTLPDWEYRFNLRLPERVNPEALAMARRWRAEAGSDRAFIQRVMNWFREEPFHYTLSPPLLGENPVDEFLFGSRRGFCEHFASSTAFLLRGAGIPARVVAGYQGGELNTLGNHLLVYQYDAHAWVEAWLPGEGWVELDPTGMVAPERIEDGLRAALAAEGDESAEVFGGLGDLPLLSRMRHLADYLEFNWTKWVLGYDTDAQLELWQRWFKGTDAWRVALALAGVLVGLLLPLAIWMYWRSRAPGLEWWQREYWRVYRALQRRGFRVTPALDARGLARAAERQRPGTGRAMRRWLRLYERVAYGAGGPEDPKRLQMLLERERRNLVGMLRRGRSLPTEQAP